MKKVIGIIFFPIVMLCWTICSIIVLLLFWIVFGLSSSRTGWNRSFKLMRWWGYAVNGFLLIRLKVEGRELLDPARNYIFISNHKSIVDIPLCAQACRLPYAYLAKKETEKVPVVGYLVRKMHVAVDRKDEASRRQSMITMKAHLDQNRSIWIYPEGTRNKSREPLKSFYDGAFRLAIEAQKPIAILAIHNSDKVMPPTAWYTAYPLANVTCSWCTVIETSGKSIDDVEELKTQAYNILYEKLS